MNRTQFLKTVAAISFGGLIAGNTLSLASEAQQTSPKNDRILIVYYSWSGNTQTLAKTIQTKTNGVLFEIVPEKPYPEEYGKCVEQAKKEIKEGVRPALKSVPTSLENYETIFVGSPNWFGTYAPPIITLLDDPKFAGKTIVPFFTHGGGGMQNCEKDMRSQLGQSTFLKALTINGRSAGNSQTQRAVENWLREIEVSH